MGAQPLWSTTDKDTGSTVSNGDRTATQAAMNPGTTRSARGVTAGKWYVEIDLTTSTDLGIRCGVVNASAGLATAPGGDANGWTVRGDGNKVTAGNNAAYGNALDNPLRIALDAGAGRVWFGEGASTWFAGGDPAAGTGEAFSGLAGVLHLAFGANNSANVKIGALRLVADHAGSPPAGFTAGFGLDAAATAGAARVALAGQPATPCGSGVAQAGAVLAGAVGRAAAAATGAVVAAGRAALTLAGRAVPAVGGATATGGRGRIVAAGRPAVVIGVGGAIAEAGAAIAGLRGLAAGITAAAAVAAAPGILAAHGTSAVGVADAVVAAGPATPRFAGRPAAGLSGTGVVAAPSPAALRVAGSPADVATDAGVGAEAGRLVPAGLPATAAGGAPALALPARSALDVVGLPATATATQQENAAAAAAPARQAVRGRPALGVASAPLAPPVPPAGDLAALLADPQTELEWVAVIEPWDAEAEAIVPLRWSVRGMVTGPQASLPNATIPARLADFRFRRSLWSGLDLMGASGGGDGVLLVDAAPKDGADGGLEHLATATTATGARRWHFRRRAARVLLGHPRWGWDDLVPVWTGTVADLALDGDRAQFQLRDATERLDRPVQERAFAGDRVLVASASSVAVGTGGKVFALPDLVANGGFAASLAGWSAGTGWSWSGGAAAKAAGTAAVLEQEIATAAGNEYRLRATVTRTAGTLQPRVNGRPLGAAVAAGGTLSLAFVATGSATRVGFAADASFQGSLDAVTCRAEPRIAAGDDLRIARTAALTGTWMAGTATAWSEALGEVTVEVQEAIGFGTHADWSIWVRPFEGPPEAAGKPLPVAFGSVRHAAPVELGSVQGLWLYRLADAPVRVDPAAGHGLFDGGVALTPAAAFPPQPGEALVDEGRGIAWVASRPAYPLTAVFDGGLGEAAGRHAFAQVGVHAWTVPPGVAAVRARLWGGGGGGAGGHAGGGAGFVDAVVAVAPGDVLSVDVGGGGGSATAGGAAGQSATSDGGSGGSGGASTGAGGGAASGIAVNGTAVLAAPGGGGASADAAGGPGGGASGMDGGDGGARHGDGGTSGTGGAGGSGQAGGSSGAAGGTSKGGNGGGGATAGGGGGGGGRLGGGGGGAGSTGGAGGGGAALAAGGTTEGGSAAAPGGAGDGDRPPGAGAGGVAGAGGGDGAIVLSWEPAAAQAATAAALIRSVLRDRLGFRDIQAGPSVLLSIAADAATRSFTAGGGGFAALGIRPGDAVSFAGLAENSGRNLTAVAVGATTLTVREAIADCAPGTAFVLTAGEIDGPAFAALEAATPQPVGEYLAEGAGGVAARDLVDRVLAGVGAWIDVDARGLVTVGRYEGPAGTADHALGEGDLDRVGRVPVAAAQWRRRLGAARCRRPHGAAEIAPAAADDVRRFLLAEWREGVAADPAVKAADLGAGEAFVATALDRREDAEAEAARQLALAGPALLAFEADAALRALAWRQGETVALAAPALGLAEPRRLVVVGREIRMEADGVTLTLLG